IRGADRRQGGRRRMAEQRRRHAPSGRRPSRSDRRARPARRPRARGASENGSAAPRRRGDDHARRSIRRRDLIVHAETLIDVAALRAHLDDPALSIFDCRFSLADPAAGRKAYLAGHIPGARYADIDADLSGPRIAGVTGRHPLPARDAWIARVEAWGISPERQVVAYDDSGGAFAARLWWMLRWIGHSAVAVLDGGWRAWVDAGCPTATEMPQDPAPSRT